jgi:hypothetical protein
VREEVESELDVDYELREDDADEDPSLTTKPLALLVRYVGVVLPKCEVIATKNLNRERAYRKIVLADLVAGAAISPVTRMRATQRGCSAGMGKMCLTKNVFSSTICHTSMNWEMATQRIHEQEGSSQQVGDHVSGVN